MRITHVLQAALLAVLIACSSSNSAQKVQGGATGALGGATVGTGGGSISSAGSSSSGTKTSGGAANAGGMVVTGGLPNRAGASQIGGASSTGGVSSAGGAFIATGGVSTSGGSVATGGNFGTGGATATNGSEATGGAAITGGAPSMGGSRSSGGVATAGGTTNASTSGSGGTGITLYGNAYTNVNMWYGPVDFAESQYHNACGLSDGSKYPTIIQSLYGSYLIGLDGGNIPNVASHCDDCAQLTANGKTIIAHVITYGTENGTYAIDLSPEAQTALGLSSSNWTGTWQFSSCPTNGTPIYYEFDSRQWNPQNFWYMRIWTRNQRIPVTLLETKIANGSWAAATQQDDGAWQTPSGVDFSGGFQVRVTGTDSQQLVDVIPAPPTLDPAVPLAGQANFH